MSMSDPHAELDPAFAEGLDWVVRMASDDFSEADRTRFARWRAADGHHAEAFARAAAFGDMVRSVARDMPREAAGASATVVPLRRPAPTIDRRAAIVGALAASVAGVVAIRQPLAGRAPDYSTGVGERRRVAVGAGLDVELDAKTDIAVERQGAVHVVSLLRGRAAVDARLTPGNSVSLVSGKGRTIARTARFDVDAGGEATCVTCISGGVLFDFEGRRVPVGAQQQISYSDGGIGQPRQADVALATAWTSGQLIFHRKPLQEVIHEINRYRPGRVVLLNGALADRRINAVFHVAQIEGAVDQLQQISGARITRLPGSVVVFS